MDMKSNISPFRSLINSPDDRFKQIRQLVDADLNIKYVDDNNLLEFNASKAPSCFPLLIHALTFI